MSFLYKEYLIRYNYSLKFVVVEKLYFIVDPLLLVLDNFIDYDIYIQN